MLAHTDFQPAAMNEEGFMPLTKGCPLWMSGDVSENGWAYGYRCNRECDVVFGEGWYPASHASLLVRCAKNENIETDKF